MDSLKTEQPSCETKICENLLKCMELAKDKKVEIIKVDLTQITRYHENQVCIVKLTSCGISREIAREYDYSMDVACKRAVEKFYSALSIKI